MSIELPQREAEELQYSLRSTFFYRKRTHYKALLKEIRELNCSLYDWTCFSELNISKKSWNIIRSKRISPCFVFCHPDIIESYPHLIAYYRSIAVLSQKGVQRLAFEVKTLEQKKRKILGREKAIILSRVFNGYIGAFIEADFKFSIEDIQLVGAMSFGTQINGSWRNEIGIEGTRHIKELIFNYFLSQKLISKIILKDGRLLPVPPSPTIDEMQGFIFKGNYKVIFGSEPDISIFNPKDVLEVAIEVKAGIDPAGALERYGAAKKSFDKALKENKSATTIYLASCITNGVKKAMRDDRLVRREFNLGKIFMNGEDKEDFLDYIKWLVHL